MKKPFAVTVFALLSGTALAQTQPVNIGINVGSVNDFAVESQFVDAMKHARHWGSAATPWDQAASVDALGWPMQDAGAVILCCVADAAGHSLLAGTYALSFTGSADVRFTVNGSGTVAAMHYDTASNTSTAAVTLTDQGAGSSLILSFTNTRRTPDSAVGSGVTGVALVRPQLAPNGHAWWKTSTQAFTSPFLQLLKPYSTLRFMDFTATNNSPATTWALRPTKAYATQQTAQGASWEYAVALANTLHKDIWINIPDQADTDYVTRLASLLAAKLDPALNIWLEYSNEVWNYSFVQAQRNQAAAEAEVAANPGSPLAFGCADYDSCRYEWGERRIGLQAALDGNIFKAAFGAGASRVRPVFATQIGQTYFVSLVFSMLQATMGPPSNFLYAIAQAPYWSGDNGADKLSAAKELAAAAASIPALAQPEADFAAWATLYGMHSVTYEGGPGMSGTASLAGKIQANRSAGIGTLVQQSLRQAFANGMGLYMFYDDAGQYGQYGMWGATETVFDLRTPKLKAMAAVRADIREKLTAGTALPGSLPVVQPGICNGGNFIQPTYLYLDAGASCGYLVNVPAESAYTVAVTTGNYGATTSATLMVDQAAAATFPVPADGFSLTDTEYVSVTLSPGLHVLSLAATGTAFGVTTIAIH